MGYVDRKSVVEKMAEAEAAYIKMWMEIHSIILQAKDKYKKNIKKQPQNHKRTNHYKLNIIGKKSTRIKIRKNDI